MLLGWVFSLTSYKSRCHVQPEWVLHDGTRATKMGWALGYQGGQGRRTQSCPSIDSGLERLCEKPWGLSQVLQAGNLWEANIRGKGPPSRSHQVRKSGKMGKRRMGWGSQTGVEQEVMGRSHRNQELAEAWRSTAGFESQAEGPALACVRSPWRPCPSGARVRTPLV